MASLDTCRLRVRRADARLEELRRQVADYVQANQHVALKVQGNSVSVDGWPDPPPPDIGITVGEVAHNLRCALDYLVHQLAILATGEVNMRTQFPIEERREGFRRRRHPDRRGRANWLTGLDCAHCATIEALQPYNGVAWTAFLRDLSNEDKHRTIPVMGYAGAGRIRVGGTEDEAKAMGGFRKPGDANSIYFPSSVTVMFNSDPPVEVISTLEILRSEVSSLIESFAPDFGAAASHAGAC